MNMNSILKSCFVCFIAAGYSCDDDNYSLTSQEGMWGIKLVFLLMVILFCFRIVCYVVIAFCMIKVGGICIIEQL